MRDMKCLPVFVAFTLLSLSFWAYAEDASPATEDSSLKNLKTSISNDVTPAMEQAFLSQLKTAIAHKDYKLFRELFYESENSGRWLELQTVGPFDTILSDVPRVYSFKLPTPITGMGGRPITPSVTPIFFDNKWSEKLILVRELIITFPMNVPNTVGKIASMPLIVKNGKLFVVDEMFTES